MSDTLLILPALHGRRGPSGGIAVTRKFIDGVHEYAARWPGPVRVLLDETTTPDTNLDGVEVDHDALPFEIDWAPPPGAARDEAIASARIVLATLVDRHTGVVDQAGCLGVPVVYISEYSCRTRRQIVLAETANPILRMRRQWWTMRLERRYEQAVRSAAGVQCNGTPTYDAYASISPDPLLYFDSRVRPESLVPDETLAVRHATVLGGAPLRLAFSGRLIAMKGADHLPLVAAALEQAGVPFEMSIFGGGSLEPRVRAQIERSGLSDRVTLRGVLDFERELMPHLGANVDLFICCHRQGDPSCTYLETMACGVPIVGYDNEAWSGLARRSQAGWMTPLDRPDALADRIAELHENRLAIVDASRAARSFASRHLFDATMQSRVDHLSRCASRAAKGVAA